jgi:hypothetical protein
MGARRIKLPLPALRGSTEPENGVTRFRVLRKCRADGHADIEAAAGAAQVAFSPPAYVALHLIFRVEAVAVDQAFAKAKRHAGVIGPLAWLQTTLQIGCARNGKRAAPNHVRKRFKRAGRLEFQCGAQSITGSQPEQRAVVTAPQYPQAARSGGRMPLHDPTVPFNFGIRALTPWLAFSGTLKDGTVE